MESRSEKQISKATNKPPVSAYLWLTGMFLSVFAVIYIALILRTHFMTIPSGKTTMGEAAANLIFAFAILTMLGALYLYMVFSRMELLFNLKEAGALLTVFTIVIVANIFIAYFNPYGMLVSLTALLALPFSKKRDAFCLNVFACLISSFVLINTIDSLVVVAFTSITGVLTGTIATYAFPNAMTRATSVLRSFLTGVCMMGMYAVFLCAYKLDATPFAENVAFIAIAAAAQLLLAGIIVPVTESVFNITTDYKLMELINHKAPLIHRLITEAPGTFNHSLAVANFAEICAAAIGEDPYLARACAYYHDVGKLNNAMYFTENQAGYNPHDELLPEVSSEIICQHTVDGYELCKENRIPEEIARVTIEHHGTLPIAYFYNKAKTLTDGEVDMDEYRYHGDTPRGKIAAIIMICDSAEAAIRAMDNPDGEKVDRLLKGMIDERIKLGQFDNCNITLKDLNTVRSAIVGAYGGLFHKRIKYNIGKRDNSHV